MLKTEYIEAMKGTKTDKYAIQLIDNKKLFELAKGETLENSTILQTEELKSSEEKKPPSFYLTKL